MAIRTRWWSLAAAVLLLSGCGGAFRIYDEPRAKMAAGIKDKYSKAEVLGTVEVERRNLDNLLAEELKVVRDNQQLRVDFALLRIADDNVPMARTYTEKADIRLKELGFAGLKQARADRLRTIDLTVGNRELQSLAGSIKGLTRTLPPACRVDVALPLELEAIASLRGDARADAEEIYRRYRTLCEGLRATPLTHNPGALQDALTEWNESREDLARLDQSIQASKEDVAKKTKEYQDALADQKGAATLSEEKKKELQDKATAALKVLEKAKDAAKLAETKGMAAERVEALVVLLSAAAGGTVTTSDERLKKAATVAKEIPSLTGDMTALLAKARAPSVNNLLIETRHQIVLLELVKELRGFAQKRTDILKARYDALKEEARLWLRFGDAVCSYAVVKAGLPFPRERCDEFVVTVGPNDAVTCHLGAQAITDCRLEKSWNVNIRERADDVATRELYKALAAYLQALASQGTQHEQTFHLIDIGHREALANREAALRGWDNLVAVPIGQLDAYYQAGLKPAEIADLLVKALGFTAIAVGVAR
jgi:hypothetical protein